MVWIQPVILVRSAQSSENLVWPPHLYVALPLLIHAPSFVRLSVYPRYLTDKEEESIVNLCFTLASMGFGVSQDDVVQLINEYINLDKPQETRVSISSKIFRTMMARHPGVIKLVSTTGLGYLVSHPREMAG
jgi:trans-aconitate methyltransferase